MSLELLNTLASLGTFAVIAATALAALIQLRHLRVSNQLQGLLAILSLPYEAGLQKSFVFVTHELEKHMQDREFRRQLEGTMPIDREVHLELMVCDYSERLGSAIKYGLLSEELYFDNSSPEQYWLLLAEVVAIHRRARGPVLYDNFEYLVARSRAWDRRHPIGNYPSREPRLLLNDRWLEQDRLLEGPHRRAGITAAHTPTTIS
ncbi:MAG: hypothetical protein NVS1B14_07200 [Vulcanimicrobiaceae bacterium]